MAASSKNQLARLYIGGLSLPALSFIALLTGFTFSMALPSSLQAVIPAMESIFLVSLPQLYRAFLSWVTPPCLFVLLNGIIMILTATSGKTFSSNDGEFSGLGPNLALQIESVPYKQSATDLEPTSAEVEPSHDVLTVRGCTPTPLVGSHSPPTHRLHTEEAEEGKLDPPKEAPTDVHGDDKQIVLYMDPEKVPAPTSQIDDPGHEISPDDLSSSSSTCDVDIVKGGSEPSSPYLPSSPTIKSNIRRSISIDSAPLGDNEGASEHLSEEAFRKRIEDFIFKMNSKIRSETRVI